MGIFLAFLAAGFSTTKDLFSKKLAFSLKGIHSAFASFLFALPFYAVIYAIAWFFGWEALPSGQLFWGLVLLRSLTDSCAEWLKMTALHHGDISLVSSFLSAAPLFLLFTSPLITGDPLTLKGVAGIALIVIGSLIAVFKTPTGAKPQKKGIAAALAAAFFFSLNSCFDRLAVQEAGPIISGFAMTALSALMLLPFLLRQAQRFGPILAEWKGCATRGFFEIGFMVFKLWALQFLQAPYVIGIQKSGLLFSIVGGKILFKEEQFLRRFLAGLFVFAGVLVIIFAP
jgi:uncharacterized membrane protein